VWCVCVVCVCLCVWCVCVCVVCVWCVCVCVCGVCVCVVCVCGVGVCVVCVCVCVCGLESQLKYLHLPVICFKSSKVNSHQLNSSRLWYNLTFQQSSLGPPQGMLVCNTQYFTKSLTITNPILGWNNSHIRNTCWSFKLHNLKVVGQCQWRYHERYSVPYHEFTSGLCHNRCICYI